MEQLIRDLDETLALEPESTYTFRNPATSKIAKTSSFGNSIISCIFVRHTCDSCIDLLCRPRTSLSDGPQGFHSLPFLPALQDFFSVVQ